MPDTTIDFTHGLGDVTYFCHTLPLYARRDIPLPRVACSDNKAFVFRAAGVDPVPRKGGECGHPWCEPPQPGAVTAADWHRVHKGYRNLSGLAPSPLPPLGDSRELYDEYAAVEIDAAQCVSPAARGKVRRWLEGLPRPVVLIHANANTSRGQKDMPGHAATGLARAVLDGTGGGVVFLDWDRRTPYFVHARARHSQHDFGGVGTEELVALTDAADLMVGVDSGPLHLTRVTKTPALGVWHGHHPASYALPSPRQAHAVVGDYRRNVTDAAGPDLRCFHLRDWGEVPGAVLAMLAPPRYLPGKPADDLYLRRLVASVDVGVVPGHMGPNYVDRHRTFDAILRLAGERFDAPRVVETGALRQAGDVGAGMFTYVMGFFLHARGAGRLTSVELNPRNAATARELTGRFGVEVVESDSVAWLKGSDEGIDVLYLDSLDTDQPGCAEHGLAEIRAALPRLDTRSVVVFDDTPKGSDGYKGKGALAVPWMLANGWRMACSGYQCVLVMDEPPAVAKSPSAAPAPFTDLVTGEPVFPAPAAPADPRTDAA